MKNLKINYLKKIFLLGLVLLVGISCERELSDEAQLSTYSKIGDVFTDTPVGLGSNFYFPYGGSKATAWSIDSDVSYKGTASMRFDVPNANDPEGNYAGGIFRIDGAGRDLTGYDALTFWAKASQGVSIDQLGFGEDFNTYNGNKYIATITNVSIGTNWQKIIIPIPDASKLVQERGMFRYAAGTQGTNGSGYVLWIDELKFEKLGTLAQPQAKIFNGLNLAEQAFSGSTKTITGLTETFNTANGQNITVNVAPSYYNFVSSATSVASVNEVGVVSVIAPGTTTITATIGNVIAIGSLVITSNGALPSAPVPPQLQPNVKSIFSDAYVQATTINTNPQFGGSTTQTSIATAGTDSYLIYSNNNYTGIIFDNTVDASTLGFMHVDIYAQQAGVQVEFQIRDIGANGVLNTNVFTGQPELDDKDYRFTASGLTVNGWNSYNIPLAGNIANQKNNLGAIIIVGGPNFILDNIYFYKVPTTPTIAAPTPTVAAANVISLFSNAYTNVPVDTWRTPWSSATFADVTIAGNDTKEYSNLDFVGIETVNNQINASAMTHVHLDVWSANYTSFSIKLVDFGANAVFGGGDDKEHQLNFASPLLGQWISYDIPLSNFTGLTTRQNLAQYILVAQPSGSAKVYVDNFYFHN
ncbi:glycosyl hydrolase family 16 [Flavobacterium sp.]|uniref:glycosyl hydrolase family 16 n=1 Tax=Flavobacterium sp. TaxID=239 RepID=UPI002489D7F2|nr:glycosyl hydrolase family 16 [Flavobacterium sp.]MDI1317851.1 glycosyl hydrolase family 16 [Flavobacterium sp.]